MGYFWRNAFRYDCILVDIHILSHIVKKTYINLNISEHVLVHLKKGKNKVAPLL